MFRTLPNPVVDSAEELAAATPTTGKFVVSFTITVASAIPSTAKIACVVNASTQDLSTLNLIEEEAAVVATRVGSTATCTVTIPYSWKLASPTTDKVTLTYSIEAPVEASATTAFPQRLSTQSIGTIAVPATGSTTPETVTATI